DILGLIERLEGLLGRLVTKYKQAEATDNAEESIASRADIDSALLMRSKLLLKEMEHKEMLFCYGQTVLRHLPTGKGEDECFHEALQNVCGPEESADIAVFISDDAEDISSVTEYESSSPSESSDSDDDTPRPQGQKEGQRAEDSLLCISCGLPKPCPADCDS